MLIFLVSGLYVWSKFYVFLTDESLVWWQMMLSLWGGFHMLVFLSFHMDRISDSWHTDAFTHSIPKKIMNRLVACSLLLSGSVVSWATHQLPCSSKYFYRISPTSTFYSLWQYCLYVPLNVSTARCHHQV